MNKLFHKILTVSVVVMTTIFFVGCSGQQEDDVDTPQYDFSGDNPIVQIEMEDGGTMVFELYHEYAPKTVENFVNLTLSGFYDGLTFHRIIEGFMIQGGDPLGDGTGGASHTISGEFAANGFTQNTLEHTFGVISMARGGNPDSASSQFFIMDGDIPSLDGNYAAFGMLIEGEETLRAIAQTPVSFNPDMGEASIPKEDVVIKEITVVNME